MLFFFLIIWPILCIIFLIFFSIRRSKFDIFFGLFASMLQYLDTLFIWFFKYKDFFIQNTEKIVTSSVLTDVELNDLFCGDYVISDYLILSGIFNFENFDDGEMRIAKFSNLSNSILEINFFFNNSRFSLDFFYTFNYSIFFDSLSFIFILLTNFIIPIALLSQVFFYNYRFRSEFFVCNIFFIQFLLINCFLVSNLLFFFILFEIIIIPVYLLIGIFGSRLRKIKANNYFFFYTIISSSFLLFALLLISAEINSFDYFDILSYKFKFSYECFLWFCFFVAFATKVPIFPFHLWLPEAHVEAPTSVSIILASLLLKLGGYGFIRFVIPLFPAATYFFWPLVCFLTLSGITFGTFLAVSQIDIKKIIAYSSIVHMNLAILGIFSLNTYGYVGGIILMLSHAIVSSGLFFLIGVLYERYHTRVVYYYGGLAQSMPVFSTFLFLFLISNIGFPGTLNFISEFLLFLGIGHKSVVVLYLLFPSFLFAVMYSFWLFNKVCFGELKIKKKFTIYYLINVQLEKLLHWFNFLSFFLFNKLFFSYVSLLSFLQNFLINIIVIDIFLEKVETFYVFLQTTEINQNVLEDLTIFLDYISILFLEFESDFISLNSFFDNVYNENFLKKDVNKKDEEEGNNVIIEISDYLIFNPFFDYEELLYYSVKISNLISYMYIVIYNLILQHCEKVRSHVESSTLYEQETQFLFLLDYEGRYALLESEFSDYPSTLFSFLNKDICAREFYCLLVLFKVVLFFGIFPQSLINLF